MSCPSVIISTTDRVSLSVSEATVPVTVSGESPIAMTTVDVVVEVALAAAEPVVVEMVQRGPVGPQGPAGPQGDAADLVCPAKPSASLLYDAQGRLAQVDYLDGRVKLLTYDGAGLLSQVSCPNLEGGVVTKTLGYVGGVLTSVAVSVA